MAPARDRSGRRAVTARRGVWFPASGAACATRRASRRERGMTSSAAHRLPGPDREPHRATGRGVDDATGLPDRSSAEPAPPARTAANRMAHITLVEDHPLTGRALAARLRRHGDVTWARLRRREASVESTVDHGAPQRNGRHESLGQPIVVVLDLRGKAVPASRRSHQRRTARSGPRQPS